MKKKSLLIICAALTVLSLTGCGTKTTNTNTDSSSETEVSSQSDATSATETTSATDATSETEASADTENTTETANTENSTQFQTGLWEVINNEDIEGWYYFSDDKTECSYHDAEGQGGIAFDYEIDGDDYIFHMGAADNNTYATVAFDSETDATITWSDGKTSKIRFVENTKYEDFDTSEGRGDIVN